MKITKTKNGKSLKFRVFSIIIVLSKTYKLPSNRMKLFLFQLNKFENGYIEIYFRIFKKYSIKISDIKLKNNKRYFLGNYEYKRGNK